LLKQDATPAQIDVLCDEAISYGFKSCCVNGIYAEQVARRLKEAEASSTIVCCVVGFPLGAGSAASKAFEAKQAIEHGALEIDTVLPLGLLLSNPPRYSALYEHLHTIVAVAAPVPVKVILETSLIPSRELKIAASLISAEAGAAFVKTSTGFAGGGATKEDVRLMYETVKDKGVKVKASGGVRSFEACKEMFAAGAERIGTSSGVTLVKNASVGAGAY
jgi:deoxyribose-phosphate aldolase